MSLADSADGVHLRADRTRGVPVRTNLMTSPSLGITRVVTVDSPVNEPVSSSTVVVVATRQFEVNAKPTSDQTQPQYAEFTCWSSQ